MAFRYSGLYRGLPRTNAKALAFLSAAFSLLVLSLYRIWFNLPSTSIPPLLWSRSSLHACLSMDCLHQRRFADQRLSDVDAFSALHHMRTFLRDRPDQPPMEPKDFLNTAMQSTCAVIGGAPLPSAVPMAEQSRLLDRTTDIVIRLNVRVPELLAAEGLTSPLGTRTDAILVQRGSLRCFERYIHGWGEGNVTHGTVRRLAGQILKNRWHPVTILRLECPSRFRSCPKAWEALKRSSLSDWMGLHLLHFEVEMQTNSLLEKVVGKHKFRIGSDVASTGIVAVVAALRLCKAVNVFMFNGSLRGDRDIPGHAVWAGHKLEAERELLRWLAICPPEESALCGKLTICS